MAQYLRYEFRTSENTTTTRPPLTPQVAKLIVRDRIDILVELAGHTAGNRLDVLSHRPAPLQLGYLGYPNTTGHPCVDVRLTDEVRCVIGNIAEVTDM